MNNTLPKSNRLTEEQMQFAHSSFQNYAQSVKDEILKYEEVNDEEKLTAIANYVVRLIANTRGKMKAARIARKAAEKFHLKLKKYEPAS